jgi:DNA-binding transcriptional LysR family regulator
MVMTPSIERWEARIGRRLRLRDLHVLLAAVQCGSMAKAARQLAVSQPAISKAIADLEHTLEVRLLDRGPQGIEPTLYGSALVRRGLAVFDELRQAVGEIEFMANPTVGEVRIGCNESLSVALLPAVIERLSALHPGVTVHVSQMSRPISSEIRQLRERNVDLIIGRGIFQIPENDLNAEVLFEEPFLVVAGARSPWARRRKLELAELVDARWIVYPPNESPGVLVEQAFRVQGLAPPRPTVTTSSFHLRDALLMTGDFLTVVPACMLRVFNAKRLTVKSLPIDLDIKTRPVAVFTLKNRTLNPVAEIVIKCVRAVAMSMYAARRAAPPPTR